MPEFVQSLSTDLGRVIVLVSGLVIFGLLHVVWPNIVRVCIKVNPEVGGEWVGQRVYLLAGASICMMFVTLCYFGPSGSSDSGVTAILTTVAIMFGYGQLVPSAYFPSFEQIRLQRLNRLIVQEGQDTKVKMVVHNTGIVAWKASRISLEVVDKRPWWASWSWISWLGERPTVAGITLVKHQESSERLSVINEYTMVQLNFNLLAVGEPAILIFNLKAENAGEFRWRVRVTNGGAPGEKHDDSLKLTVLGT